MVRTRRYIKILKMQTSQHWRCDVVRDHLFMIFHSRTGCGAVAVPLRLSWYIGRILLRARSSYVKCLRERRIVCEETGQIQCGLRARARLMISLNVIDGFFFWAGIRFTFFSRIDCL